MPVYFAIDYNLDIAVALYNLVHISLNVVKLTACVLLPVRCVRCALDNSSLARGSILASAP
jgi:hypothetical protein